MLSDTRQFELWPSLDSAPEIVRRIYRAAEQHYAAGTRKTPTIEDLSHYLERDVGEPCSVSTIERAHRKYPDYFPRWPIPRGFGLPSEYVDGPAGPAVINLVTTQGVGGTLLLVNDTACRVLGFSREDLRNSHFESTLRPGLPAHLNHDTRPDLIELGARILAGEFTEGIYETHWRTRDGRWLHIRASMQAARDMPGTLAIHGRVIGESMDPPQELSRILERIKWPEFRHLAGLAAGIAVTHCALHHPAVRIVMHTLHALPNWN